MKFIELMSVTKIYSNYLVKMWVRIFFYFFVSTNFGIRSVTIKRDSSGYFHGIYLIYWNLSSQSRFPNLIWCQRSFLHKIRRQSIAIVPKKSLFDRQLQTVLQIRSKNCPSFQSFWVKKTDIDYITFSSFNKFLS